MANMFDGMDHLTREEKNKMHRDAVISCQPISKDMKVWGTALQMQRDKWLLEGKITKEEYERFNAISDSED